MQRRQTFPVDELPPWWFTCEIERWSPDELDPIRACLAWYSARGDWAKERGLETRDLPSVRDPVPHYSDGCHTSHKYDEACDRPPPRG